MNGRTTKRFSLRFGEGSILPLVEITVTEVRPVGDRYRYEQTVVARRWGFTSSHAYTRALRWAREHGDPR